jgi:hypothetical protein
MQCTAKSKRTGNQCRAKAMPNGKCFHHGGNTPSGIASPQYVTGRYAQGLPKGMLEKYEKARIDPELLNLSDDLGMVESRIIEILGKVQTGDAGETWTKLESAWTAFRIAQAAKDGPKTQLALATIGRTIETGNGDWAVWREVFDLVERRRKLVESEGKRRLQMQDMTDNAKVMIAIDKLVDSVVRNVADPRARAAIQRDLDAIFSRGLPGRPLSPDGDGE